MRIFSYSFLLVVILAFSFSCEIDVPPIVDDSSPQLNVKELKSTWILEEIIDKETNESMSLPKYKCAGFSFQEEGRVVVKETCNVGQGKYEVSGNEVTIVELGFTELPCFDCYEGIFTRNLSGTYIINGDKLTIISNSDKDLILKKADHTERYGCDEKDEVEPVDITDHVWQLEYLKVNCEKTQPENQYLLEFGEDSRFGMDFSVNAAGGDYMINNDGGIAFHNYQALTEICCDSDFDQKLSTHLERVYKYEVSGNNLILTGRNGDEFKFRKK